MADEFYLQLYRQCNTNDSTVPVKPMFLVMAFLSRYMVPSSTLMMHYEDWLHRKRSNQGLDRYIRHVLSNWKILGMPDSQLPPDRNTLITWPPSLTELNALDSGKNVKVKVVYPDGASRDHEVDEVMTVETMMKERIFQKGKFKNNVQFEPQLYWLYAQEDDAEHFPMPISREKRILKLLYEEEKRQESLNDFDRHVTRNSGIMRKTVKLRNS